MGLKNKAQDIWKKITDLDGGEESVKNAKDKGRIPFKEISQKLKTVMKDNVDVVGRRIIIPGYYLIYCNEADRKIRSEVEEVVCEELKEELYHEIRKINPEQNKRDLMIEIKTDCSLPAGQFRIEHHIKKTDVEEKSPVEQKAIKPFLPESQSDYEQTVVERIQQNQVDDQKTVVQKLKQKDLFKLLIDSGEETHELSISKETITIGRGTKDDVILASPDFSISRTHATLSYNNNHFTILPQGVNGTFLNGKELELNKSVAVSAGDEIKIMNYRIKIVE